MSFIDLHCHSTASDGTLAPAEVVRLAKRNDLSALSLTDHDTIGGIAEAAAEAAALGIDFLPGIEISCECDTGTMHLLGYGVEPASEILHDLTRRLLAARDDRNPRIIRKLNELGLKITMAEVEAEAGGVVVGRPHIAALLLRKGYVNTIKQAFDVYLGTGGSAYFDKERIPPREAFDLIHRSGGLPALAHPIQLRTGNDAQLERIIKDCKDMGLVGLEVLHSDHNADLVGKYSVLAEKFGLLKTGGSDFHGTNKKDIDLGFAAGRRIPRAWFDALIEKLDRTRKVDAGR